MWLSELTSLHATPRRSSMFAVPYLTSSDAHTHTCTQTHARTHTQTWCTPLPLPCASYYCRRYIMHVFTCICNVLQICKSVTLGFVSMHVGLTMQRMMCITSLKNFKKYIVGLVLFSYKHEHGFLLLFSDLQMFHHKRDTRSSPSLSPLRSNCAENIRKHILHTGKHENVKMYNCPKCTFGTNSPMEFRNHLKDDHPDIENPDLAYLHAGKTLTVWYPAVLNLLFLIPTTAKCVFNVNFFFFLFWN